MKSKIGLQNRITALEYERKCALGAILELYKYMQSSKFAHGDKLDGYIATTDVFNRLTPVMSYLQEPTH